MTCGLDRMEETVRVKKEGRGFNSEGELELYFFFCFVSHEVYSTWSVQH